MANFMPKTWKPAMAITGIVVILLLLLLVPVISYSWNLIFLNFLHLWILIKRRPFIYIILNFIIISILISNSTFTLYLHNFLCKFHKSSSSTNNNSKTKSNHLDDDTWWCHIVHHEVEEDRRLYAPFDGTVPIVITETVSFQGQPQQGAEKLEEDDKERNHVERRVDEEEKEEEEEMLGLDATWKAIMEAKSKGSGPQIKKSDTWSSGGGGGGGGQSGGRMGRLDRYEGELNTWRTSKDAVNDTQNGRGVGGGGGGGGSGGGGGGGWRRMEVVLADHDELNKRADAFIAQFTHSIRLQRLESDHQRLLEMNNRAFS